MVIARMHHAREVLETPARRARISRALLHFAMTDGARPKLTIRNPLERRLLAETALDALYILRGAPRARLVELLRENSLDRRLRRQALAGKLRDRLMAIEGLRLFPDAKTLAVLQKAERSRDLRVWLTALQVRVALGAGPDMLGLLELARRPGAARTPVMQDLIAKRAELNPPEALRALAEPLPVACRALLVRALGETGRLEALSALRIALRHPEGQVRSAAAAALGALGFASAEHALARALSDSDWRVRLKAVEAIARLGLWQRAPDLEPLLADRVWWVRFRAEEALRNLSDAAFSKRQQRQTELSGEGPKKLVRTQP